MYARFFQTGCTILHSCQQYMSSGCSISYQHLILSGIFIFNHFHRYAVVVSQCGFNLHFPNVMTVILTILSCAYLPSTCISWWNACYSLLPIFWMSCYSLYVLDMFWIAPCQICDFQIFSLLFVANLLFI